MRRGLASTPEGSQMRPGMYNDLGNHLDGRYNRSKEVADLIEALGAQKLAIQASLDGGTEMPRMLQDLWRKVDTVVRCLEVPSMGNMVN